MSRPVLCYLFSRDENKTGFFHISETKSGEVLYVTRMKVFIESETGTDSIAREGIWVKKDCIQQGLVREGGEIGRAHV